ncbi:MAG TPA: DUF4214 domain-containing protein [Gemmataceae bacterium]|nr:DUF4214 domain-containing protein [Gemmataceae bacterium]
MFRRKSLPRKPACSFRRLFLEELENRVVPAQILWNGNGNDLSWVDAKNWNTGTVPTSADDVTINVPVTGAINISAAAFADSINDQTAGLTIALGASLSVAGSPTTTFAHNVTVSAQGTLAIGSGTSVVINTGVTLTDSGTVTFTSGDSVDLAGYFSTQQIVVASGGLLTVANTTFTASGNSNTGIITVNSGGHLEASGTTFDSSLNQVYLDNNSILNAGDLTGNSFNCPLWLPEGEVQYLSGTNSNNQQFQNIDILAGNVPAGQTIALNAIGASTANLTYVFPGAFTVGSGATLKVAANLPVVIDPGITLTDDGTLTFASGDSVDFAGYFSTQQIAVGGGGLLTATNSTFTASGNSNTGLITVNGGGHLKASGSTFASSLNQVYLDNSSILNAGDLSGNSFNCALYLPENEVQFLSGTGSNNVQFAAIFILGGTVPEGQTLALNAIGTSTSNLTYVFAGNLTVASNSVVNVAADLPVVINPGVTLTASGTVTFGSGDSVNLAGYFSTQQIVVGSGGLLTIANTTFTASGNSNTGIITVNSGGHLEASGSTFNSSLNQVYLDNNSILNAGDLTGNSFNCALWLPESEVQYLSGTGSNNVQFAAIFILAGTEPKGQTLALNSIGTSTENLSYAFAGDYTVAAGATLNIAANLPVVLNPGVTLEIDGIGSFASGDSFNLAGYFSTQQIVVGGSGSLTVADSTFSVSGNSSSGSITVNGPGSLQTSGVTTMALPVTDSGTLTVQSGTLILTSSLTNDGILTIAAGSTVTVSGNYSQSSLATLNVQVGGSPSSGEFSQLMGNGSSTATIGGPLNIALVNGFEPADGADYPILTFSAVNGLFTFNPNSNVNSAGQPLFTVAYNSTSVLLQTHQVPTFEITVPASVTAGTPFALTLTAVDGTNNTQTHYTGTVQFTSSDASHTLPANYTFTSADQGVHTFTGLILRTAGTQSIGATDTVNGFTTGAVSLTVNPAAASVLLVTGFTSTTIAGAPGTFTVTAKDPYNNKATGYTGTVHFTSSDGQAARPGNYTFTSGDNGVHTFSAALKTVGVQSISATDTATATITGSQAGIVVTPAAASTFVVAGFTSPVTAGTPGTFTVTARDPYNNTATGYLGTVRFTSSDGQAARPGNYTFTSGDNGVHTFSAILKTAGAQSLTATDTVTGSITGSQTGIMVSPAGASILVVSGFPSPTAAGTSANFTITAKDPYQNIATGYTGTVTFGSSDPQAAPLANYTFTQGDGGVHTFAATLKTAGTQSITATDTTTATVTGSQSGIMVNPAAASTFVVTGFTSPVGAGTPATFVVTAKDPYSNTATGYVGTVHFSSSDGQAARPGNYTFTSGDAGVHTFSAILKTAGTQSITATDTTTAAITGSQSGIMVNPGAVSRFVVTGFTSPASAGTPGTFTVTAKDPYSNTATGYLGTVRFTSSDGQAARPGNYTFTSGDNGVHTFRAILKTAGSQSLTATDTVIGSIAGSQSGIMVSPAAASILVVSGFPSPAAAGTSANFTVTADDPYKNIATGYTGTVTFSSSDPQAKLPANAALTNGTGSFSAAFNAAGTESLTAADTVTSTITGSESGIVIYSPTVVTSLLVTGFSSPVTAGTQGSITVTAENLGGQPVTGYLGTVQFNSSDAQATNLANYAFTSSDNGTHTFSVTLKTAGTQSIAATDTATSTIMGSQSGITVNPAAPFAFVVNGFTSPVTAGTSRMITVTAKDAYNNTATGYVGTMYLTSSDGEAALPGNYTFTLGDSGARTFSVALKTAGTQSITATDTATGTITGGQSGITVNPAAPSGLLLSGFPSPVTAGTQGTFTVTVKDAYNNTLTGYLGTIHFASSDGDAALPGNYTFTSGDSGVHTFSATLKRAGSQAIVASEVVTDSIAGSQSGITVTAGLPTQITVVSGSGQSTAFGTSFVQPVVGWVTDSFGNGVPGVVVTFTTPTTGPSGDLASATATTSANGLVSQTVTANGIAGSYQITASVAGVAKAAAFQLTNLPATISGTVFQDININGAQDPGEPGIAGQTVFLDLSGSGTLQTGDPTATSDSSGNYQFTVSSAGTYTVRQVQLGGVLLKTPASGGNQVTLSNGLSVTGQNFADVPTSIAIPLTLPLSSAFPKQGNGNADFVDALYRAILDRNAEPGGLAYWTNLLNSGALSRLQVVQDIRTSPEHFTQEVTDFYFTLLDRAPDAAGLQSWVQQLENGSLTEEQVAFDFLDSPEYLSKGDKYFVDHMYLSLLGRTFDPVGEANWLNWLGDDLSGNPTHPPSLTHEKVIMDFLRSPESLNRLVEGYYQVFLQRLSDPQGLSDWLAQLNAGASFLIVGQGFLSSDEFYNNAAAEG